MEPFGAVMNARSPLVDVHRLAQSLDDQIRTHPHRCCSRRRQGFLNPSPRRFLLPGGGRRTSRNAGQADDILNPRRPTSISACSSQSFRWWRRRLSAFEWRRPRVEKVIASTPCRRQQSAVTTPILPRRGFPDVLPADMPGQRNANRITMALLTVLRAAP